jgi:hypothetical protein
MFDIAPCGYRVTGSPPYPRIGIRRPVSTSVPELSPDERSPLASRTSLHDSTHWLQMQTFGNATMETPSSPDLPPEGALDQVA